MCRVLEVSRSGYYAWVDRPLSERAKSDKQLMAIIKALFIKNRGVYGAKRLWKALKERGVACGRGRVARLMRQLGLRAKLPKRFTVTTQADARKTPAANLLNRDFSADHPNEKWCADITYIWTDEGWLYLAAVLDLYSRRIVGWAMDSQMASQLVCDAWEMAIQQRRPATGLLHHSDRGSQYTSDQFQTCLQDAQAVASMSRKGNCYDNAAMESFFGTLKVELVSRTTYRTRKEAKTDIFFYIEGFYNRTRLHSTLGYMSPEAYEAQFLQQEIMTLDRVH